MIMNNSKKPNLTILFFSILLGIFMAWQFNQNLSNIAPVTLRSIQITKNEINAINKEIEDLNRLMIDKKEQLKTLENTADGDEDIIDVLIGELNKNRAVAGFEKLEGPGIIIKMDDNKIEGAFGEEYNLDIIHDADVLKVINDLRGAGAEAISINEQRVLSITEVKCGGPVIRVNGKSVGAPFFIKAIGDPKLLNASINAPNSYTNIILRGLYNLNIEATVDDNIIIPAYSGRFNFKYAKPSKEGD